jgi:sterol desaturase/sphingolipid hydroxylase (fatty acid hydroxylase superfamily)
MSLVITYLSGLAFNLISGLAFSVAEHFHPFRKIEHRKRILRDLGAIAVVWVFFIFFAALEERILKAAVPLHERLLPLDVRELPLWVRIAFFYLTYDFLSYWAHRWMHTHALWRAHVWHHSADEIWWLSGCRGSLIHVGLYRVASVATVFCLFDPLVAMIISTEMILSNSWMHLNLRWFTWMRPLELIFVTPRFHHLHHGVGVEFRDKNFGSRFTVWDRLFGTYLDPDSVSQDRLFFGVAPSEKLGPVRAAIGL